MSLENVTTEDYDDAFYLSNQVEQAKRRAVLAASDAGVARDRAASAEQQAREYAKKAGLVVVDVDQAVLDARAAADRAEAPTDSMVAALATNPVSLTRAAVDQATGDMITTEGSTTQAAGDARWVTQSGADILVAAEIERTGSETQISGDNRWVTNEGADGTISDLLSTPGSATQASADTRFARGGEWKVSADQFGAVGDGSTDDTATLQAALNSGAKVVWVPGQKYLISAPLRVPADVSFITETATLVSVTPGLEAFITIWGSYLSSNKHELSVAVNSGARVLTTKTNHSYVPGDVLRLVSQRVSTDPVDAGDGQLGWETAGGQGPFFSEFVRVQSVTANTVTIDNGLLFNGYRPNNTQETNPNAGASAYLTKTNGAGDNARVFGFKFEGEAAYGVRVIRAQNVRLRDLEWVREQPGRMVQFNDCYMSDAERCYIETRQWEESDVGVDHAAINQYHVVASWRTGFTKCRSIRGTQPYDFTYASTALYPSVWCYVKESTAEGNLHNPVTAHPGTYGIIIHDNTFTDCQRAGISIRSNAAEVTHNQVRGSMYADAPGMYVLEGGGKSSRIESNTVEGFDIAARLNDGGGKPFPTIINTLFRANTFRGFRIGWMRTRITGQPIPTVPQGISLIGNRFESDVAASVAIVTCESGRGINGLVIQGNEFIQREGGSTVGILVTANSKNTLVKDNVFHVVSTRMAYDPTGFAGSTSNPDVVIWGENQTLGNLSGTPAVTDTFKIRNTSNEILYVNAETQIINYSLTGKFRTASNAQVKLVNGFPVDTGPGWWEVVELPAGAYVQTYHRATSGVMEIYRQRVVSGVPGGWVKVTFAT